MYAGEYHPPITGGQPAGGELEAAPPLAEAEVEFALGEMAMGDDLLDAAAMEDASETEELGGPHHSRPYKELLTKEQEVDLAKCIEAGVYAGEELARVGPPPPDADADTRQRYLDLQTLERDGRSAVDTMIRCNVGLIKSIVRRYTNGPNFDELMQEGYTGLERAVQKFDYTLGYRFSTYATKWIRRNVARAAARIHGLPERKEQAIRDINRVEGGLQQILGQQPTIEEIARELDLEADEVVELQRYARSTISLDANVADGDETLANFIVDDEADSAMDLVAYLGLQRRLAEVLASLPGRQGEYVSMYFGIGKRDPRTFEEIAVACDVSLSTVGRNIRKAMATLRKAAPPDLLEYL